MASFSLSHLSPPLPSTELLIITRSQRPSLVLSIHLSQSRGTRA